jgi:hypothetical protein
VYPVSIAQLVEQQVVGLKAEGSTPSIHPVVNEFITVPGKHSQNKGKSIHAITQILSNSWGTHLLHFIAASPYTPPIHPLQVGKRNPFFNNFLENEFKFSGIKSSIFDIRAPRHTLKSTVPFADHKERSMLTLFKVFIKINAVSVNALTAPHASFRLYFIRNKRGGAAIMSLPKLFNRWKSAYYLTYNLYYYRIDILTFAPSFFRNEVLSLNWQDLYRFKYVWRYTRPFLTLKPNKITNHAEFIFRRLRLLGLSIGLVTDILYHHKTIYYLRRSTFYSIGLVPSIYHINSVDFAIPTTYESILMQVFFVKFLTRTRQTALTVRHAELKTLWGSYVR